MTIHPLCVCGAPLHHPGRCEQLRAEEDRVIRSNCDRVNASLKAGVIDLDAIMDLVQADDNLGLCIACGEERGCCEPDAENYPCESCEQLAVFGAPQLLLYVVVP